MAESEIIEQTSDMTPKEKLLLSNKDLSSIQTAKDLEKILTERDKNLDRIKFKISYERQLIRLQVELVKLQRWIQKSGRRVIVIFEGRDAAGKGGTIRRFTEHLNPRAMRIVAMSKPTDLEMGQ